MAEGVSVPEQGRETAAESGSAPPTGAASKINQMNYLKQAKTRFILRTGGTSRTSRQTDRQIDGQSQQDRQAGTVRQTDRQESKAGQTDRRVERDRQRSDLLDVSVGGRRSADGGTTSWTAESINGLCETDDRCYRGRNMLTWT